MARLNAYLTFDGTCREAMGFYQACLGGEVWMQTFGESPMAEAVPADHRDRVLHAMLSSDGLVLMASDLMPGQTVGRSGPITLCLNSEDRAEITGYFHKLADGATITQPLDEMFFGLYGALTDKYGIEWLFQAGAPAE
jgi:PhnB protein